jgi:hypothetical protein
MCMCLEHFFPAGYSCPPLACHTFNLGCAGGRVSDVHVSHGVLVVVVLWILD